MKWVAEIPLCIADTETTSANPEEARLVELCLGFITPGQPTDLRTTLVDSGVDIPEGAAAIHGYSTEMVRAKGRPVAEVLDLFIGELALAVKAGRVLIIQNAPYDATVLDREARRHALPTLHDRIGDLPLHVVDPLVLDRKLIARRKRVSKTQGARCLKTLAQVYGLGWDDQKAHGAEYDALMAARVVYQIARRTQMSFPQLRALGLHPNDCRAFMELKDMSPAELHDKQVGWYAEQSEDLALFFRNTATLLRDDAKKADPPGDAELQPEERAQVLRDDADGLIRRADGVATDWPMTPFTASTTTQEAIAA